MCHNSLISSLVLYILGCIYTDSLILSFCHLIGLLTNPIRSELGCPFIRCLCAVILNPAPGEPQYYRVLSQLSTITPDSTSLLICNTLIGWIRCFTADVGQKHAVLCLSRRCSNEDHYAESQQLTKLFLNVLLLTGVFSPLPLEFDKFLEDRAKVVDSLPSLPGDEHGPPLSAPSGTRKKAERTEDALFAL